MRQGPTSPVHHTYQQHTAGSPVFYRLNYLHSRLPTPHLTMASSSNEALALVQKAEAFLSSGVLETLDAGVRRKLSEAARKLNLATEATGDTVHRIVHSVCATNYLLTHSRMPTDTPVAPSTASRSRWSRDTFV